MDADTAYYILTACGVSLAAAFTLCTLAFFYALTRAVLRGEFR